MRWIVTVAVTDHYILTVEAPDAATAADEACSQTTNPGFNNVMVAASGISAVSVQPDWTNPPQPIGYSLASAAQRLGVDRTTVETMVTIGELPVVFVDEIPMVRTSDLEQYMRDNRIGEASPSPDTEPGPVNSDG